MIPIPSAQSVINILPEVYAAVTAALGGLSFGIVISFPSPALPSMEADPNFAGITNENVSWMASMAPLAALIATPFIGAGVNWFPRKTGMYVLSVLLVVGWLLISFANGVLMVYAGRFFTGFAIGGYSMIPIIFINETASEALRGRLASLHLIAVHTGILLPYLIGPFLGYKWHALSLCPIPILMVVMLTFVPESPRYLLSKGHTDKAFDSLRWLRGGKSDAEIKNELALIGTHLEGIQLADVPLGTLLRDPRIVKPTAICICLMLLQAMTGIDAILSFKYQIFVASGSSVGPNLGSIIVGAVQVVAVLVAGSLMDRFGRRRLLLISEAIAAISLFFMGLSFYLLENGAAISKMIGWLPLVSLVVFEIGFSLGIGPIPWIYLEILPSHLIGLISGMAVATHWAAVFLVTQFFTTVQEAIGGDGCFWGFAGFAALGWLFVFFFVGETKGKTLEELHQRYGSKKNPA